MRLLETIKREVFEIFPTTIFFLIAFSLILVTTQTTLRQYGISWTGSGFAIVGALLAAKVVLIADRLPFVNRFPDRPLIYNTVWKSCIYLLVATLVQYLRHFGTATIWDHFWLAQMWLAVLFFVYCGMREMIRVTGRDKVVRMFFGASGNTDKEEVAQS